MRILQIIPSLDVGGAESVTYSLASGLTSKGHHVSMLTESTVPSDKIIRDIEYLTVENPLQKRRIAGLLGIILWGIRNRRLLRNFDIVHCHLNRSMLLGLVLTFTNSRERPAIIATCHSVGGNISNLKILFEKLCSFRFDAFVLMATNEDWTRFSKKKWGKNLHYIQNGIVGLPKVTQKIHRRANRLVVGTLSRLNRDRKPELFLYLFREISNLNKEIDFVIGGAGPLLEELKLMADNLELNSIRWLGEVSEKPDFFQEIDLYITLMVGDTSGIAGLEAISAGLPVFGIQLLEKFSVAENKFIYSSANLSILAKRIVHFLTNPKEIQELKHIQAKTFQSGLTFAIMLDKYESLYKTLLKLDVAPN